MMPLVMRFHNWLQIIGSDTLLSNWSQNMAHQGHKILGANPHHYSSLNSGGVLFFAYGIEYKAQYHMVMKYLRLLR